MRAFRKWKHQRSPIASPSPGTAHVLLLFGKIAQKLCYFVFCFSFSVILSLRLLPLALLKLLMSMTCMLLTNSHFQSLFYFSTAFDRTDHHFSFIDFPHSVFRVQIYSHPTGNSFSFPLACYFSSDLLNERACSWSLSSLSVHSLSGHPDQKWTISFLNTLNTHNQKYEKVLVRRWRNLNSSAWLVEYKMVWPLWKIVCSYSKLYIMLPLDPIILVLRYMPKGIENICSHKNLYINVHGNIIHKSQKWKQPKWQSIDEWIIKRWFYLLNRLLFSHK